MFLASRSTAISRRVWRNTTKRYSAVL